MGLITLIDFCCSIDMKSSESVRQTDRQTETKEKKKKKKKKKGEEKKSGRDTQTDTPLPGVKKRRVLHLKKERRGHSCSLHTYMTHAQTDKQTRPAVRVRVRVYLH